MVTDNMILIAQKLLMKFFSSNEEFIKYELENYLQLILLSSNKEKYLIKIILIIKE